MNTRSSFYDSLTPFNHFDNFIDDEFYIAVPEDHLVVVADIRGSTQAVKDGKYKDVNLVGAAAITSLISALGSNIPFVFGGDGASVIIHGSQVSKTQAVLQTLSFYAKDIFDLNLCVGMVAIPEILNAGYRIDIAKYQPDQRMPLAMFRGGGLQFAEALIKNEPQYQLNPAPILNRETVFEGLTCRWQDIKSTHGLTMSVMVSPLHKDQAAAQIKEVLLLISQALGGSFDYSNPLSNNRSGYRSVRQNMLDELRYHDHWWSKGFLKRCLEILFVTPIFGWGLFKHIHWAKNYVNALGRHADFQKFDDMLRMVIDCTPEQVRKIKDLLETMQDQDKIVYGLYTSESAQMTCFVQGVKDGEHIHFIDGSDGGYTLAAAQMKQRIKANLAK